MKIRIVSDLHIDINKTDFDFEPTDLLLIAGDIAGSWQREYEYLYGKDNCFAVGGNHLGYDYWTRRTADTMLGIDNPKDNTKEDCLKQLTKRLPNYLNDTYVKFQDKIIFGGTMYSNFLLYGKKQQDACKWTSMRWLNDFRCVHTYDRLKKEVRPLYADDYIKWHKRFMKNLKKCLEETTEDVIVLSHFAPSIKSINKKYLYRENRFNSPGSELNAAYANNLVDFITDNPRIKLWVHGHCHSSFDYNIEQCRVVCEPYGYYQYDTDTPPEDYQGKVIEI